MPLTALIRGGVVWWTLRRLRVQRGQPDRPVSGADFGTLNPAGTSQYLRLVGRPTVHLMPRHVGTEWEVTADMARRILPPEAGGGDGNANGLTALLLPASIDR